ncbi:hypothetical protein [Streptomyces pharetrae]|uniref:hypothetical protein n=1 Tax=Streptomyces pharetrae TaxID=291370 RepID=UPI0013026A12
MSCDAADHRVVRAGQPVRPVLQLLRDLFQPLGSVVQDPRGLHQGDVDVVRGHVLRRRGRRGGVRHGHLRAGRRQIPPQPGEFLGEPADLLGRLLGQPVRLLPLGAGAGELRLGPGTLRLTVAQPFVHVVARVTAHRPDGRSVTFCGQCGDVTVQLVDQGEQDQHHLIGVVAGFLQLGRAVQCAQQLVREGERMPLYDDEFQRLRGARCRRERAAGVTLALADLPADRGALRPLDGLVEGPGLLGQAVQLPAVGGAHGGDRRHEVPAGIHSGQAVRDGGAAGNGPVLEVLGLQLPMEVVQPQAGRVQPFPQQPGQTVGFFRVAP